VAEPCPGQQGRRSSWLGAHDVQQPGAGRRLAPRGFRAQRRVPVPAGPQSARRPSRALDGVRRSVPGAFQAHLPFHHRGGRVPSPHVEDGGEDHDRFRHPDE
jgi:hypothetical protein